MRRQLRTSGISVSEQEPTVHCAAIAYNNTRLCRDFAWQEIISGAGNSHEDIPIRADSPWYDCHKSINLQRKSPSALVRKV